MSVFPVSDENQESIGIIISTEDITERKNAEIEKEKMTADLIQHNKNLEQFAYIISHNLRSPVANMLGLAYILENQKQMSKEEINKSISGLVLSVKRLDEVIIDLNYILQKRRELHEKKEPVNLTQLLEDIRILIGLPQKDLIVHLNSDFKAVPEMFSVKSYLHSIFYNLISNSIKYRHPERETEIHVETAKKDNRVILRFSDNGMGIDMQSHGDKVFGLYKKFHNHIEGKGMGLYLVKTQVELLGGRIQIDSAVNRGVTFTIEFND